LPRKGPQGPDTKNFTLPILRDLLGKRRSLLEGVATGRLYLPLLQTHLDAIEALPQALTSRPMADELAAEDQIHDGLGAAVWHLCQAYLHHPTVPKEVRAAAEKVLATFIPSLGELRRPYADEALAAQQHEPEIERLAAELGLFPVAGEGTLNDWVMGFVGQGKKIDALLSQRGEVTAVSGKDRRTAAALRSGTVGLLGRLRASLGDETLAEPKLDRTMPDQVFGYHDELLRLRTEEARARARTQAKKNPPETTPPKTPPPKAPPPKTTPPKTMSPNTPPHQGAAPEAVASQAVASQAAASQAAVVETAAPQAGAATPLETR
jgi:hypothetical protein